MSPSGLPEEEEPSIGCQRELFSLPDGLHYLNCAYMAPLPRAVEEAIVEGVRLKRNPADLSVSHFFDPVEEVRRRFGSFLAGGGRGGLGGGDLDRVAVFPSVSYGVSLCARNLPVPRGSRVVVTAQQFPGNVYAWLRVAAENGGTVVVAGPEGTGVITGNPAGGATAGVGPDDGASAAPRLPGGGRGARWNEHLLDAITPDTAVVSVPHVHWTDGTRFDLEAVGRRAREVGAALVIDGTQSVGALSLDLDAVRPDAVIAAAYKWLLGPYSMALAWLGPRFDDGVPLEETWMSREGSDEFRTLVEYDDRYRSGARRYDVGEVANFALLPGVLAALELLAEWRPARIQAYCADLTASLVKTARERGFVIEDDAWRGRHLFGIRMPPDDDPAGAMERLKVELDRRRIVASFRGTALRVSPNVYNDENDVGALEEALRKI